MSSELAVILICCMYFMFKSEAPYAVREFIVSSHGLESKSFYPWLLECIRFRYPELNILCNCKCIVISRLTDKALLALSHRVVIL